VLFTAVIAVLSLFRKLKEDERWGDER